MRRRGLLLLLLPLCLTQMGTLCGEPPVPPSSEECNAQELRGTVATLEQGPNEDTFRPWREGETWTIVHGPQGFPMITMRLRITGTDLPLCLAQHTVIMGSPDLSPLADYEEAIEWYQEQDGSFTTHTVYVVLDREPQPGEAVTVTTTVLGATSSFVLAAPPPADAGV